MTKVSQLNLSHTVLFYTVLSSLNGDCMKYIRCTMCTLVNNVNLSNVNFWATMYRTRMVQDYIKLAELPHSRAVDNILTVGYAGNSIS